MSSLSQYFTSEGRTERETFITGSTVKKHFTPYITSFFGHIQPASATLTGDIPGSFGKQWVLLCPVLDIKEGDKVEIENKMYKVDGVEKMDFLGINKHMEVLLRAFEQ